MPCFKCNGPLAEDDIYCEGCGEPVQVADPTSCSSRSDDEFLQYLAKEHEREANLQKGQEQTGFYIIGFSILASPAIFYLLFLILSSFIPHEVLTFILIVLVIRFVLHFSNL